MEEAAKKDETAWPFECAPASPGPAKNILCSLPLPSPASPQISSSYGRRYHGRGTVAAVPGTAAARKDKRGKGPGPRKQSILLFLAARARVRSKADWRRGAPC